MRDPVEWVKHMGIAEVLFPSEDAIRVPPENQKL